MTLSLSTLEASATSIVALAATQLAYAAVSFVLITGLCRLLRRRSPTLHFGLWSLVLVRLVLPPDLAAPWSIRDLFAHQAPIGASPPVATSEAPFLHPPLSRRPAPVTTTPVPWALAAVTVWLVGAGATAIVLGRRRHQHLSILARARAVEDGELRAIVERSRVALGVNRTVALRTSDAALSPFTAGTRRPAIYLPRTVLEGSSHAALTAIIAHEMAHIRRLDDLQLRAQNLFHILYFFVPFVWWTTRRLREERERLCDDLVLANTDVDPTTYARALLDTVRLRLATVPTAALGDKRSLEMRLQRILHRPNGTSHPWRSLATVAVLGLFLLPMATTASRAALVDEPTTIPEIDIPEIDIPEIDIPEIDIPEIDIPEIDIPEIDIPEIDIPEIDIPEIDIPEIDYSALTHPSIEFRAVRVPAVKVPAVKVPAVKVPAVKVPAVKVSAVTIPAVKVSAVTIPAVTIPAIASRAALVGSELGAATAPVVATARLARTPPSPSTPSHTAPAPPSPPSAPSDVDLSALPQLTHPLPEGRLTSPYGHRINPISHESEGHRGIDIAAPTGTPVRAPADGRVELVTASYQGESSPGKVIIVDHGEGTKTFYAHLGAFAVAEGDTVVAGQTIAEIGSTGASTGPHVHFEVWHDGEPIDPALALGDR